MHDSTRNYRNLTFAALLQRAELGVLLDGPVLALREVAVVADEHLGGLLVALQLPLEPGEGYDGELAAGELDLFKAKDGGNTKSELRIVEVEFLKAL